MAHQQLHVFGIAEELFLLEDLLDVCLVDEPFLLEVYPAEQVSAVLAAIVDELADCVQL